MRLARIRVVGTFEVTGCVLFDGSGIVWSGAAILIWMPVDHRAETRIPSGSTFGERVNAYYSVS